MDLVPGSRPLLPDGVRYTQLSTRVMADGMLGTGQNCPVGFLERIWSQARIHLYAQVHTPGDKLKLYWEYINLRPGRHPGRL
jgi:hypothetical protein